MLKSLFGRITGKDQKRQNPVQQASFLGRIGDYLIIYPYGMYCDLPNDVLLSRIGKKSAIPITIKRPSDTAQGEPVLFHPETNTRIVLRNNGNIDAITKDGGVINLLNTQSVNIQASNSVNVDSPQTNLGQGGPAIARVGDSVEVTITSGSSSGIWQGVITSGGSNTSI